MIVNSTLIDENKTQHERAHSKQSSLSHPLPVSTERQPSIAVAPIAPVDVEAPPISAAVNKQVPSDEMTNVGPQASNQLFSAPTKTSNIQTKGEKWVYVGKKKKYTNRFAGEKGTCTETAGGFKAAISSQIPLFINNVHKDTCENDKVSYVRNRIGVQVTLCKIKTKQPREYNSYKMFVPKDKLTLFLDCNVWPDGITFRKFVEFRERELRVDKRRTN
ncbi:hypothetical protein O0L34_g19348 [Tuta absoluta]|nr:hypothetical protein O0L34_g19348 [Tuta absoluta]